MPFEKKCECVGAEATFCTNEKLTRIDKKKNQECNHLEIAGDGLLKHKCEVFVCWLHKTC